MGDDLTIGEVGRICQEIKADVKELDTKVGGMSERLAVLEATRPAGMGKGTLAGTGVLGGAVAVAGEWLWHKLVGGGQ